MRPFHLVFGNIAPKYAVLSALAMEYSQMADEKFPVEKSATEWRSLLSADQFRVLREHGTERAGTSPLNYEKRTGVYHCAACHQPLFESGTKYESGSGWPSFFRPLPDAVATTTDRSHGMTRVEVHCRNCGGHLGHVFDDGPQPTGQRYCMNGVSLKFEVEVGIGPDSAKSAEPL
jgi:peptide-methionine (R)-S-oxide reductase